MKRLNLVCLLTLPMILLSGCSSSEPSNEADCLSVPETVSSAIKDGASGSGFEVKDAAAVKTAEGNYMVALSISDATGDDQAVWLTTALDGSGSIASVDEVAAVLTRWPHTVNGQKLSITMDGASEAVSCVS